MEIFRIEKNGSGPYEARTGNSFDSIRQHHWHPEQGAPASYADGIGDEDKIDFCALRYGFESFWHMRRWFHRPDTRKFLNLDGFQLSVYKTEKFILGQKQCVFDLTEAKLVRKLPIPI